MMRFVMLVCAVSVLTACATYRQQKYDLDSGNAEKRVNEAQGRLDNAKAEQESLREDQLSAEEELAALQDELAAVNANHSRQKARLAEAQRRNKAKAPKVAAANAKLNNLTDRFNDTSADIGLAQANGDDAEVKRKEAELRALKARLKDLDEEIDVLAE
ncbi:MAG: hypothetical protein ACPGFA_12550 [Pikeienuella sp.]